MQEFNTINAPLAELQFYGSYSRVKSDGLKESYKELCERTLYAQESGLFAIGKFTSQEEALIEEMQTNQVAFGSARFLWCGGTDWLKKPENWHGVFNCTTRMIKEPRDFGIQMSLGMQGCGTGSVLEQKFVNQLPVVNNGFCLHIIGEPGEFSKRKDETSFRESIDNSIRCFHYIVVGDSRQGWVDAYQKLIDIAFSEESDYPIEITINLGNVRPLGAKIKGFGGSANPEKLSKMFERVAEILNGALGRKLTSIECCLLIDEPAACIQAGGVRRFAGMKQFSNFDTEAATAKDGLWTQDNKGNWRIDPKKEALQASNHTRVYHEKPTLEECVESVRKQYYSGEGAIQYAAEAIARANCDLLDTVEKKNAFLNFYPDSEATKLILDLLLEKKKLSTTERELKHRLNRLGLNPCGELVANDNHCNLGTVALAKVDPFDWNQQKKAFKAAALQTAALLQRNFEEERFKYSRDIDPVVIVSFTESFDFFTRAFGVDWVRWWSVGRPKQWSSKEWNKGTEEQSEYFLRKEKSYLKVWSLVVHDTVWEYCERHGIKCPNRCTGLKPEGSLTLLTGVGCCGVHPPKAWRVIRRKEFRKDDPVAIAAIDYGYSIMPLRGDKDKDGNLLNDPWSDRCTGWVVEVPIEEPLIRMFPEIDCIDPSNFSALAQLDWVMQVQKHYSTHNTSCTIELRENEIEELGTEIYRLIQENEGYVSVALLARFDDHKAFPRLPFEPITKEQYQKEIGIVQQRRKSDSFYELLNSRLKESTVEFSPNDGACDGTKCLL